MRRQALVSVSDKTGLEAFAGGLVDLGFELISTGGTARALRTAGLAVRDVSEFTGSPEVLDGRVKTLHPRVFAAVLADLDVAEHGAVLRDWGLEPISLVAVNLYPFEATATRPGVGAHEVVENIDIGGPSLVRAAAKNHRHVAVVVDPADYDRVLDALRAGASDEALRRELAVKAFRHTAAYDATIAALLPEHLGLPPSLVAQAVAPWLGADETPLRYGENPHQRAVFARPSRAGGLGAFVQLQGKELSYNNLMDTDGAWRLVHDLPGPGVAIIKHAGPSGVGLARHGGGRLRASPGLRPGLGVRRRHRVVAADRGRRGQAHDRALCRGGGRRRDRRRGARRVRGEEEPAGPRRARADDGPAAPARDRRRTARAEPRRGLGRDAGSWSPTAHRPRRRPRRCGSRGASSSTPRPTRW